MPKGVPNKRYTPEFKQKVVEAAAKEGLSYQEAAKLYKVNGYDRIQSWERIYLTEGPEGFTMDNAVIENFFGLVEHRTVNCSLGILCAANFPLCEISWL